MHNDGPPVDLSLTWDDVAELLRVNPLAAEQAKNIAMRRMLAELQQQLAVATGSESGGDSVGPPDNRAEEGL